MNRTLVITITNVPDELMQKTWNNYSKEQGDKIGEFKTNFKIDFGEASMNNELSYALGETYAAIMAMQALYNIKEAEYQIKLRRNGKLKAGIVCDDYKVVRFREELQRRDVDFDETKGFVPTTRAFICYVETSKQVAEINSLCLELETEFRNKKN